MDFNIPTNDNSNSSDALQPPEFVNEPVIEEPKAETPVVSEPEPVAIDTPVEPKPEVPQPNQGNNIETPKIVPQENVRVGPPPGGRPKKEQKSNPIAGVVFMIGLVVLGYFGYKYAHKYFGTVPVKKDTIREEYADMIGTWHADFSSAPKDGYYIIYNLTLDILGDGTCKQNGGYQFVNTSDKSGSTVGVNEQGKCFLKGNKIKIETTSNDSISHPLGDWNKFEIKKDALYINDIMYTKLGDEDNTTKLDIPDGIYSGTIDMDSSNTFILTYDGADISKKVTFKLPSEFNKTSNSSNSYEYEYMKSDQEGISIKLYGVSNYKDAKTLVKDAEKMTKDSPASIEKEVKGNKWSIVKTRFSLTTLEAYYITEYKKKVYVLYVEYTSEELLNNYEKQMLEGVKFK